MLVLTEEDVAYRELRYGPVATKPKSAAERMIGKKYSDSYMTKVHLSEDDFERTVSHRMGNITITFVRKVAYRSVRRSIAVLYPNSIVFSMQCPLRFLKPDSKRTLYALFHDNYVVLPMGGTRMIRQIGFRAFAGRGMLYSMRADRSIIDIFIGAVALARSADRWSDVNYMRSASSITQYKRAARGCQRTIADRMIRFVNAVEMAVDELKANTEDIRETYEFILDR